MRNRMLALAAAVAFLLIALGIRLLVRHTGIVDNTGALAQDSGTALYASAVYAGSFVLVPKIRPWQAGFGALAFCWAVEFFQLTGVPATLSAHSSVARLALGVKFDPADLAWYPVGIIPPAVVHQLVVRRAAGSASSTSASPP